MSKIPLVFGVAGAISLALVGSAFAQRTPADYALFWNYWKDNCETPTTTGGLAYGCPAVPRAQPTPTGNGDTHGTGGSGGGGGGSGSGG